MANVANTIERAERAGFEFLMTDLGVALTLVRLASKSDEPRRKERNTRQARRAYDTVVSIGSRSKLTADELKKVSAKVKELKSALKDLGEKF